MAQRSKSPRSPVLTLSLNLREAQLLSLSAQRGVLSVALRNPNDLRVAENISDLGAGAIFEPAARAEVRSHRRHADGSVRDTVAFSIIESECPAVKRNLQYRLEQQGSKPA